MKRANSFKSIRLAGASFAWAAILVLLVSAPIAAQDVPRSYGIEAFRVELQMEADGGYQVVESIDFVYEGGTYSQGFRRIGTGGLDAITDLEVTSPQVEILDVQISEGGRSTTVTWDFEPRGEPTTFEIRYRVWGALQEVENRNRIAWDAVGSDWEVPIRGLDVRLVWPDFELQEGEIAFVPQEEGTLRRVEGAGGWEVRYQRDQVAAGTPYGVQVSFPTQLDGRDPPTDREGRMRLFLGLVAGFLLAFVPGTALAISWRNPSDPPTPVPEGPPPLELAQGGYLAGGLTYWGVRVFAATLVDLARRGHVRLMRTGASAEDGATSSKGTLEVTRTPNEVEPGDELSTLEADLLDKLDEHDSYQDFIKSSTRFQTLAYRTVRKELAAKGVLEENGERAMRVVLWSFALAAALGLVAWRLSGPAAFWVGGAALGIGPALWVAAGQVKWRRTEKGARMRAHVRQYLKGLRERVDEAVDSDPSAAARLLAQHLPWMMVDPRLDYRVVTRLEEALEEEGSSLDLPDWIRRAVGGPLADGELSDDTLMSFFVVLWIVHGSRPSPSSSGMGGGMGGGFSGGAGVSTGVGGGGGGMR